MYGDYETTDLEELMESDGVYEGEDWEGESDFEDEAESFDLEDPDPFLGDIVRAIPGPAKGLLKGLAGQAATYAGNAIAGQRGAQIGRTIANRVMSNLNWESSDFEEEAEASFGDFESVGGDTQVLQEMSHLANLAAESQNPAQADQFLGAIAGLAGKLLPQLIGGLGGGEGEEESWDQEGDEFFPALLPLAAQALPMAMPLISKGIGAIGKLFGRKRKTRRLMEALPVIAAKTVTNLTKAAQAGKPVKPSTVAAVIAKQTAKTLATKPAVAKALQANKEMAYGNYGSYGNPQARSGGYGYQRPQRRQRIIRPRYCVY